FFASANAEKLVCLERGQGENWRRRSRPMHRIQPPPGDAMSTLPYPLWSAGDKPSLLASRDLETGELMFPAVADNSPLAQRHEVVPVERVGVVYSFTIIHPGAKSGLPPYALGYVDFPGPVRIFGRFRGHARPEIGDRCEARADEALGYVFEPLGE